MRTVKRFFGNSAITFGSNLITKSTNVVAFIAIARRIGESQSGIFSLATTYLLIFTAITWGLDEFMIRQISRDKTLEARYFYSFLLLRSGLAILLYAALAGITIFVLRYEPHVYQPILVIGLCLVPDSLSSVGQGVLVTRERFDLQFFSALIASLVKIIGGAIALLAGMGLFGIGWAWLIGSIVGAIITLSISFQIAPYSNQIHMSGVSSLSKPLRRIAPFLIISFLVALEYQIDVVILSITRNEKDIAWYSAATTIIYTLNLIPQAFRIVIYPTMSRYYPNEHEKLSRLYNQSMYYLGLLSLPIAAGIYLTAGPIIYLVYGVSFQNTILPLQWLSWSLIFLFLNVPNSRLLLVSEHQSTLMRILIGSMTFNIVLNIVLDPGWGAAGAGFARLCSTMLFFILSYIFVQRSLQKHNLLTALFRPVLATLGMSVVVWLVHNEGLWVSIALGAGVYFIALAAIRGLPVQDELTGRLSQYISRILGISPHNH